MSLIEPKHATETEEADWLYEHRLLSSADFLINAAAGRLVRRDRETMTYVAVPPTEVPQEELDEARQLLVASGIWVENTAPIVALGTEITGPMRILMERDRLGPAVTRQDQPEALRKAS